MKSLVIAMLFMGFAAPGYAQVVPKTIAPCFEPASELVDVAEAFQSAGWHLINEESDRLTGLMTASEVQLAVQNLSRVDTPEGHDRHIAQAHERATMVMDGPAVLRKADLFVVVEFQGEQGLTMISCTIAGSNWNEPAQTMAAREPDVVSMHGHEFLILPIENGQRRSDLTWYQLNTPTGSTKVPLGGNALIAVIHQ